MTQQEIFQNMTKGEWKLSTQLQAWEINVDSPFSVVTVNNKFRKHEANKANAHAIVTAVNWWQKLMKQGINTESVENLYTALHNMLNWADFMRQKYGEGCLPASLEWNAEALTAASLKNKFG